ncbi:hypothetical protein CDAR_486341 [Caerostris darwini]|uniref:Ribosomal protein S8 n=1 Tax=Caerostris darwini TaxID=1538125 RepID=A0AAV4M9Z7_9ARAC|nr:hypothetical protein CDAR_486341 [Caerostris darwini]
MEASQLTFKLKKFKSKPNPIKPEVFISTLKRQKTIQFGWRIQILNVRSCSFQIVMAPFINIDFIKLRSKPNRIKPEVYISTPKKARKLFNLDGGYKLLTSEVGHFKLWRHHKSILISQNGGAIGKKI